jgi:hypothetical protein
MDETTTAGVLAYMAYRVVDSRRRDLRETIALRLFKQNGTVSAAEVDEGFAAEWVEPDAQEVADLVARKAQASVAWHEGQSAVAVDGAERQLAKAAKLSEQAAEAERAADLHRAEADALLADAHAAQELLEAAEAAGGNAARAPSPNDAEAKAQVADAVGGASSPGGN